MFQWIIVARVCYRHIIIQSVVQWTLTQQCRGNVEPDPDQATRPAGRLGIRVIISDKSHSSHHGKEVKIIRPAWLHDVSNAVHMSLIPPSRAHVIDSSRTPIFPPSLAFPFLFPLSLSLRHTSTCTGIFMFSIYMSIIMYSILVYCMYFWQSVRERERERGGGGRSRNPT